MITDEMIRQAKGLELPELIRQSNIDLIPLNGGSAFKCKCPFHEDKNPSLNLNHKDGLWLWNCFGCGAGGTAIDFIMKLENRDFKSAVLSMVGKEAGKPSRLSVLLPSRKAEALQENGLFPDSEITLSDRLKLLSLASNHYHKILKEGNDRGKAYLEKRGLWDEDLIKAFKIGYCDGLSKQVFFEVRSRLKHLGLYAENYHESFANSVIFPVLNEEGQTTDLYGRRIVNYSDRSYHLYNKGSHLGVFNIQNVKEAETIILTEGIIDALSIYKAGFKNVSALFGVNGFTEGHHKLLNAGTVKKVILALDNDEAGKAGIKRLSDELKGFEIHSIQLPEGIKDVNEFYLKQGIEAVQKVINESILIKALPLPEPQPEPVSGNLAHIRNALENETMEAKEIVFPVNESPTVALESGFVWQGTDLIFKGSLLSYTVRGAGKIKSLDNLRFVISAKKKDGSELYTDRIDLYLSRSRKIFENESAKHFKIQPAVVEMDLAALMAFIEKDFRERKRQDQAGDSKKEAMTPEEEAEAMAFLKTPNLFKTITEDITTLGYAGEDENKLLLYLCATSRKLDKPISILIRSQSSTGKSYLMSKICELMPSEDVHLWTSLTPNALYYMAPDALKHKFICIDEREGMEEAEYPIRSLQSGGKLSKAVPLKNPATGEMRTENIEKEGPISYADGSTNTRTNPENANRCFEMYLDESQEQTRRIQEQQRKAHTLRGLEVESRKADIRRIQQNAQRILKPVKVVIPYIEEMEFPSDWIRTRRDHDRFLSLIVCIAFLHQYQRERKEYAGASYIEASLKDYSMAYRLAKTVLANTFHELDKPLYDFYMSLSRMVDEKSKEQGIPAEEFSFTRRQVRGFVRLPDYLVKRYMRVLSDLEYFEVKAGSQGSRFVYRLIRMPHERAELQGFLKPSQLKAKWEAKKEGEKSPLANEELSEESGTSGNPVSSSQKVV